MLIALLFIAALIDLFRHQIPNWLTGGGTLAAFLLLCLESSTPSSLNSTLIGLGAGLAFLFPVYLMGKVGAGDVKLLAMAGAFLGPIPLFWGGLFSLIAGGVLAVVWVMLLRLAPSLVRRMVPNAVSSSPLLSPNPVQRPSDPAPGELANDPRRLPYASAIAIGCSLASLGFS